MCGIHGIFALAQDAAPLFALSSDANKSLLHRGPDAHQLFYNDHISLGHTRLAIIDTSAAANQPFTEITGRYTIVYNGEIFNYKYLAQDLKSKNVALTTNSDTEVLLQLYILYGPDFLHQLKGFFAFAIYDSVLNTLFLARDRFGVKPLLYIYESSYFIFASEMRALLRYQKPISIDTQSLYQYLQCNYTSAPYSILNEVRKIEPGQYILVDKDGLIKKHYYKIEHKVLTSNHHSSDPANTFFSLFEDAVHHRMVSDVPIGSFLSGGLDSSAIVAVASQMQSDLHTFSLGFKNNTFFDESAAAKKTADLFKTNHHHIEVDDEMLIKATMEMLRHLDEPFGDSSSVAMYMLSKHTSKYVKVALSGDGADEILGGYNKHRAFYQSLHPTWKEHLIKQLLPLWSALPKSRNSLVFNKLRQINRFSIGLNLSPKERYWRWCCFCDEKSAYSLLSNHYKKEIIDHQKDYEKRKSDILSCFKNDHFNESLIADVKFVLPNDMLTKVDLMSMAHGLEARNPFLDHTLVEFCLRMPEQYKISRNQGKLIARQAFSSILPPELINRPKHGFEIPLEKMLKTSLKFLAGNLLDKDYIQSQGIFDYARVNELVTNNGKNIGTDTTARLWGLLTFQHWYQSFFK